MSVTRPSTSSNSIRSPILIGWEIGQLDAGDHVADRVLGAKPTIAASTAVEARMPVAKPLQLGELAERDRRETREDDQEEQAAQEAKAGLRGPRDL